MKTIILLIILLTFNNGFSQENSYHKKISFIEEVKKFPNFHSDGIQIEEITEHDVLNTLALASSEVIIVKSEQIEAKATPARKKRAKKTIKLKTI
jgi:hypothetical protein